MKKKKEIYSQHEFKNCIHDFVCKFSLVFFPSIWFFLRIQVKGEKCDNIIVAAEIPSFFVVVVVGEDSNLLEATEAKAQQNINT